MQRRAVAGVAHVHGRAAAWKQGIGRLKTAAVSVCAVRTRVARARARVCMCVCVCVLCTRVHEYVGMAREGGWGSTRHTS